MNRPLGQPLVRAALDDLLDTASNMKSPSPLPAHVLAIAGACYIAHGIGTLAFGLLLLNYELKNEWQQWDDSRHASH